MFPSLCALLAITALAAAPALASPPKVDHVLIIGVDGLGPIGIEEADTPVLDQLIAEGAHTFKARGVMPTVSSSNWASMIMGAGPEQHGVLGNEWPLPMAFIKPVADVQGIFPTIFSTLREQEPDAFIAVVHDWDGFGRLFQRKMVDLVINGDKEEDTAAQASRVIAENKPRLLFVHLDHVDGALHKHGFATPPYFEAVTKADQLIGTLLQALNTAGMRSTTAIIVTSDHGGKDKSHGGNSLAEYTIPWIVAGPGVIAGKDITDAVNTCDTAATAAYLLRLTPPQPWVGRPVMSAFAP